MPDTNNRALPEGLTRIQRLLEEFEQDVTDVVRAEGGGKAHLREMIAARDQSRAALDAALLELTEESRPGLPGGVELQLGDWSQAVDGGRSDDALLYLTDRSGKVRFGAFTLGWFRQHTTFDLWEKAIISNRAEDRAARSPAPSLP